MSADPATQTAEDKMAAEWAAALEESKPGGNEVASELANPTESSAPATFANFTPTPGVAGAGNDINMILDIPVQLTVELGRTRMPIKHILQLAQGSVVELDTLAGEPMDVLVNGYLIAQGEVVVVNDKFGIRLTDIVTPSERLRRLSRGLTPMENPWLPLFWFVADRGHASRPRCGCSSARRSAAPAATGVPRSVAVLPLSAQQRVVTVEVGHARRRGAGWCWA